MIIKAMQTAAKAVGAPVPSSETEAPTYPASAFRSEVISASSSEKAKFHRVFIFDPQKQLKLLPVIVQGNGFEPSYSSNIKNVLEILDAIHPSYYSAGLVNMTGNHSDGVRVVETIRSRDLGAIPLVALMGEDDDREAAISLGVNACVDTYSNSDILTNTLRKLLRLPAPINKTSLVHIDGSKASTPHALVVDDSIVCLKIFSNILKTAEFRTTLCSSGQSALSIMRIEPHLFDIVIIDVFMADISGIIVAKGMREYNATIPIIIMSSSDEFRSSYAEVGAQAFLSKPILKTSFVKIIERFGFGITKESHDRSPSSELLRNRMLKGREDTLPCLENIKLDMEAKIFRALVVDDSLVCLKQLGKILADLGYATDLFFDGEQAFEHLSNYRERLTYDVIITDLHMPVVGGIQFIRQCRELFGVHIPIVVVSSFCGSKAAEVMQVGADLCLDKPVSRKQIADIFSSFSDTICGSGQVYAESSKRLNIAFSSTQSTRPMLCRITQELIGYTEREAERTLTRVSGRK